jgi:hypothetical protein
LLNGIKLLQLDFEFFDFAALSKLP